MSRTYIRVKLLSRCPAKTWLCQLPLNDPTWGDCYFVFDPDERDYDWLVVYDELPFESDPGNHTGFEQLSCSPQNTMLVTTEPCTIKCYNSRYTDQFRWVLTSQPGWALPHRGRIYSQPALRWFYGAHLSMGLEKLHGTLSSGKTRVLSTVSSSKRQRHTLHSRRFKLVQFLKKNLKEIDVFGRGIRPVMDKSEAIDSYKYHLVVENFIGLHHWTEKLSDAFLGTCLPFYGGCPNAADYFPPKSFIPIDLHDHKQTERTITKAIENNEYEVRLPHIKEARRRVLEKYNLFAVISKLIKERHTSEKAASSPTSISSRRALRKNISVALQDAYAKSTSRLRNWLYKDPSNAKSE